MRAGGDIGPYVRAEENCTRFLVWVFLVSVGFWIFVEGFFVIVFLGGFLIAFVLLHIWPT